MNKLETYQKYRARNKEALKCMKPEIAGKYLGVMDWLWKNYSIIVLFYETCRTFEEQWEKRKAYLMGTGVRAAPVGSSWHNFGRAVDVVPIENEKANWKSKDWDIIEKAFNSVGIKSGKDYGDLNHFEYTKGTTLTHERAKNPGWKKYKQMEEQMFPTAPAEELLNPYASGSVPSWFKRNKKKLIIPGGLLLFAAGIIIVENVQNKKNKKN